ncbi:MAG: S8 family serine peptidase [Fibrobacterales bacterium]
MKYFSFIFLFWSANIGAAEVIPYWLAQIPTLNIPVTQSDTIVIAIVDDGFNVNHTLLKEYIWKNTNEVPFNRKDDDGNGAVDDLWGWDVSDWDDNVKPSSQKRAQLYHGTHVAGVIGQVLDKALLKTSKSVVKILPVKALSDNADKTHIKHGFKGIKYAVKTGADIILCAWSVAKATQAEKEVLLYAQQQGVTLVASVANFSDEQQYYPAVYPGVVAVTAVDEKRKKLKDASYGAYVDIAAPGDSIFSAGSSDTTSVLSRSGTSMAAAYIAAVAALIKLKHPTFTRMEQHNCLINSAQSVDSQNKSLIGKLGTGVVSPVDAVECGIMVAKPHKKYSLVSSKGVLHKNPGYQPEIEWSIDIPGVVPGIVLYPQMVESGSPDIRFTINSYQNKKPIEELSVSLYEWDKPLVIHGNQFDIRYLSTTSKSDYFTLQYSTTTIDSSALYCSNTVTIMTDTIITDGSNEHSYNAQSDCRWQFIAPPGKIFKFTFLEFDTESKTDGLYFFNGEKTNGDLIARFSGPKTPPELNSWSNYTLLWFVTNGEVQGKGWRLKAEIKNASE